MASKEHLDKIQALRFRIAAHLDTDSERLAALGTLIKIDHSWQQLLKNQNWSELERFLVGESLLVLLMISMCIKERHDMSLVIKGHRQLQHLQVRLNADFGFNAQLSCRADMPTSERDYDLPTLCNTKDAQGVISLYVFANNAVLYQWHNPIDARYVAHNVQNYLPLGEGLAFDLNLGVTERKIFALLVQASGSDDEQKQDYQDVEILTRSLKTAELENWSANKIMANVFAEHPVSVLMQPQPYFYCGCTRQSAAKAVLTLSKEEITQMLAEDGSITIQCGSCAQTYQFDGFELSEYKIPQADHKIIN